MFMLGVIVIAMVLVIRDDWRQSGARHSHLSLPPEHSSPSYRRGRAAASRYGEKWVVVLDLCCPDFRRALVARADTAR